MSETSDDQHEEATENAALDDSRSEDVRHESTNEVDSAADKAASESESDKSGESQVPLEDEILEIDEGDQKGDQKNEASSTSEKDRVLEEKDSDNQLLESEGQISASLARIRDDLSRLNGKVERLENPSSSEIGRAKNLIFLLSAITGIVMVASITFFVVMSVNVSQKVSELDRVLMAVAKRGVQLGDGIEKISQMENKLVELIGQNEPIPSSLAGIESQIINQGKVLTDQEEEHFALINSRFEPIISSQNEFEQEIDGKFKNLELHVDETVDLKPLTSNIIEVRTKLETISQDISMMDKRLNDLYLIKQAEMEQVFMELQEKVFMERQNR